MLAYVGRKELNGKNEFTGLKEGVKTKQLYRSRANGSHIF
jgi:hypothetical protein